MDNGLGELVFDSVDEFVNKFIVALTADTGESVSKIKRVVTERLADSTSVKDNGDGARGVNTCTKRHKCELGNRDTDATNALVANAKNRFTIGHDNVVNLIKVAKFGETPLDVTRMIRY